MSMLVLRSKITLNTYELCMGSRDHLSTPERKKFRIFLLQFSFSKSTNNQELADNLIIRVCSPLDLLTHSPSSHADKSTILI